MLLIVYGTRPEYIKVKSIIDGLTTPFKVLFTGQHKDIAPKNADYNLEIYDGVNRLDSVIVSCLNNDDIYKNITHVLIQGDTSSVFGVALSAFHRNITVIHLEAGLRTWDKHNPYPEEVNRQMVSSIADIHLCPTELNKENIIKEKRQGEIYVVGNTGLDNIDKGGCEYGNEILITLHRRENHHNLDEWFQELSKIALNNKNLIFSLPLHPNPNVQKFRHHLKNINIIEPIKHEEMIKKLKKCKFVISDSGGLQEECSYLNKKIIVCRKVTERPETIGTHSIMCDSPYKLNELFKNVNNNYKIDESCPYGDGNSVKKIIEILGSL